MACFIVPATEALVVTAANHVIKKKEEKGENTDNLKEVKIKLSEKVGWLSKMLWGGSALLAFEHVWHGEVTPFYPFLTNAVNAGDRIEMLHEMATAGVGMALAVTAVWGIIAYASGKLIKKAEAGSEKSLLKTEK